MNNWLGLISMTFINLEIFFSQPIWHQSKLYNQVLGLSCSTIRSRLHYSNNPEVTLVDPQWFEIHWIGKSQNLTVAVLSMWKMWYLSLIAFKSIRAHRLGGPGESLWIFFPEKNKMGEKSTWLVVLEEVNDCYFSDWARRETFKNAVIFSMTI